MKGKAWLESRDMNVGKVHNPQKDAHLQIDECITFSRRFHYLQTSRLIALFSLQI